MVCQVQGIAWQHVHKAKMEQKCWSRIQPFQYHPFIAMYSIAFYCTVAGIMGMVHGVCSLWAHPSWDFMSLLSWQNHLSRSTVHKQWTEAWKSCNIPWGVNRPYSPSPSQPRGCGRDEAPKQHCRGSLRVAGFVALHQTILTRFRLDFHTSFL